MDALVLFAALIPLASAQLRSTLRFSNAQLSELERRHGEDAFLDIVLRTRSASGAYRLSGMATCPPVRDGCPFALPGSGFAWLMDDDSGINADDEMATAAVDDFGRFRMGGESGDCWPFGCLPDPYIRIRLLCPHPRGGYHELEWRGPVFQAKEFRKRYMESAREMEFHLSTDSAAQEFRDMEKLGRELLFDTCMH